MKKLIFVILLLAPVFLFSQLSLDPYAFVSVTNKTLTVAAVTDTSLSVEFSTTKMWNIEVNSSNVDGVDTLYVYGTAHPDSSTYVLIWVDRDLDGINDNPWTLSTTENLGIWGIVWPYKYIIYTLATGTSTAGLIHHLYESR